jgi:hypothetical protein
MPHESHQRAAEFHELAAHAHRAAAAHRGKDDHQTGHEHSKQAMEFSIELSQLRKKLIGSPWSQLGSLKVSSPTASLPICWRETSGSKLT